MHIFLCKRFQVSSAGITLYCGNLKEVDYARKRLGTCLLAVRNFLRGQICSLTADEGSAPYALT